MFCRIYCNFDGSSRLACTVEVDLWHNGDYHEFWLASWISLLTGKGDIEQLPTYHFHWTTSSYRTWATHDILTGFNRHDPYVLAPERYCHLGLGRSLKLRYNVEYAVFFKHCKIFEFTLPFNTLTTPYIKFIRFFVIVFGTGLEYQGASLHSAEIAQVRIDQYTTDQRYTLSARFLITLRQANIRDSSKRANLGNLHSTFKTFWFTGHDENFLFVLMALSNFKGGNAH